MAQPPASSLVDGRVPCNSRNEIAIGGIVSAEEAVTSGVSQGSSYHPSYCLQGYMGFT